MCNRKKLKVNVTKNKVIRCSMDRGTRGGHKVLNNKRLDLVEKFHYLVVGIDVWRSIEAEMSRRVGGDKVLGALRGV